MNEQDHDDRHDEKQHHEQQPEQAAQVERETSDPNLRAAVGGYRKKRRIGWYLALLLLGFGLGAALALVVGQSIGDNAETEPVTPPATGQKPRASRSGIVFSADTETPAETPDMFDSRIARIYCHFRLPDADSIEELSGECHRDGDLFLELSGDDFSGSIENGIAVGHAILKPQKDEGFAAGIYEVTITTAAGDQHSASFAVVEDAEKLQRADAKNVSISDVTFCTDITDNGSPVEPADRFSPDTERIYVVFQYGGAEPGTAVEISWSVGETTLPESTRSVTLPSESGRAHAWISAGEGQVFPAGEYTVTVRADAQTAPLGTADFEVAGE